MFRQLRIILICGGGNTSYIPRACWLDSKTTAILHSQHTMFVFDWCCSSGISQWEWKTMLNVTNLHQATSCRGLPQSDHNIPACCYPHSKTVPMQLIILSTFSALNLSSPWQCASKINGGGFSSSKEFPDEVLRFVRSHPMMYRPVLPQRRRPVFLQTQPSRRKLTQIAVDRVQAQDGHYHVLYIGTGTSCSYFCQHCWSIV